MSSSTWNVTWTFVTCITNVKSRQVAAIRNAKIRKKSSWSLFSYQMSKIRRGGRKPATTFTQLYIFLPRRKRANNAFSTAQTPAILSPFSVCFQIYVFFYFNFPLFVHLRFFLSWFNSPEGGNVPCVAEKAAANLLLLLSCSYFSMILVCCLPVWSVLSCISFLCHLFCFCALVLNSLFFSSMFLRACLLASCSRIVCIYIYKYENLSFETLWSLLEAK